MKTFSKLAVTVAFVAFGALSVLPTHSVSAATGCDAHGIGNSTLTHSTNNSAYKINGNQTTVTFDVSGCASGIDISMISWKAPNGTTGKPYAQQVMFAHKTEHFANGRHSMTIALPDCYFQVDTVTGTKLTGSTGGAFNYDARQVAFMHGGTKSCVVKTTKPPVTPPVVTPPVTPTPQAPVVTPVAQVTELPHTGPEGAVAAFVATSGAGAIVHRFASRKSRRS